MKFSEACFRKIAACSISVCLIIISVPAIIVSQSFLAPPAGFDVTVERTYPDLERNVGEDGNILRYPDITSPKQAREIFLGPINKMLKYTVFSDAVAEIPIGGKETTKFRGYMHRFYGIRAVLFRRNYLPLKALCETAMNDVVGNAHKDGVRTLDLRVKFDRDNLGLTKDVEYIKAIVAAAKYSEGTYKDDNMRVNLVMPFRRNISKHTPEGMSVKEFIDSEWIEPLRALDKDGLAKITGIDIVGNELPGKLEKNLNDKKKQLTDYRNLLRTNIAYINYFVEELIKLRKSKGIEEEFVVYAHAGESFAEVPEHGAAVIKDLAENLNGLQYIIHCTALSYVNDPTFDEIAGILKDKEISILASITSNLHTEGLKEISDYPAKKLLDKGINVYATTDDPGASGITFSNEENIVYDQLLKKRPVYADKRDRHIHLEGAISSKAVKELAKLIDKNSTIRDIFWQWMFAHKPIEPLDVSIDKLIERQIKDQFGFSDYWQKNRTLKQVFDKHIENNDKRKKIYPKGTKEKMHAEVQVGIFTVVKNLWRPLRRAGFTGTKYKGDPGAVNDGCFICLPNIATVQKGARFFRKVVSGLKTRFFVLVQPFPIVPSHITVAFEEHRKQQPINKQDVEFLIDAANLSREYSYFLNGLGAGCSIKDHFHYQAMKYTLPMEKMTVSFQPEQDGLRRGILTDPWPIVTVVLEGNAGQVADEAWNLIETAQKNDKSFNVLASHNEKGELRVYFIPRREAMPVGFDHEFGMFEIAGYILTENKKEFNENQDEKKIIKAMLDAGYPLYKSPGDDFDKKKSVTQNYGIVINRCLLTGL